MLLQGQKMLSLHLNISNPWARDDFVNLWHADGSITKHKHWEFETYRHSHDVAKLNIAITARRDHAGLHIDIGLLGYSACFDIYDGRHWDSTNNCWEIYGEENE